MRKGEANSPQKDLFLFLVASRSKKHHRYEFPSDRATGSSKLIDVASIFEARHASVGHDCKFTNDSIPHGLEIAWIFHEIRCSRWYRGYTEKTEFMVFRDFVCSSIQVCKWLNIYFLGIQKISLIDLEEYRRFVRNIF